MAGLPRKLRPLMTFKLLVAATLVAVLLAIQLASPVRAQETPDVEVEEESVDEGCAFPFTPTTYEDMRNRQLFLNTIELAAFNMLFPGDDFFGLPDIEVGPRDDRTTQPGQVPPSLLKAIAYVESSITQASNATPYGSIGPALVAFDCGHGIGQITTGMTLPEGENGRGSPDQALVATHFAYNIARGAAILMEKWNEAPEEKPIVGNNTLGHPALLENWYFALWSYNGFTGPGANRSNHPMDPIYESWPRTSYSCGPAEDELGHNRANYPYQELVIGCAGHPPSVDGELLWEAQPISLPNLKSKAVKSALDVDNFVFPYAKMDIPSPSPFHVDNTPKPSEALRTEILGTPAIAVSALNLDLKASGNKPATGDVHIFNTGTGVMAWYAVASEPWLQLTPYTGVAVGADLECAPDVPCERSGSVGIKVDPKAVPAGVTSAQITVQVLGSEEERVINVNLSPSFGLAN